MRPNNLNTAPDQTFFYPRSGEIERHEDFDMAGVPSVIQMVNGTSEDESPFRRSYVILEAADGEEIAQDISLSRIQDLPAGATILSIRTTLDDGAHSRLPSNFGDDGQETT